MAHLIANLFLMPFVLGLILLAMIVLMMGTMVLMLFGVYYSMVGWLETKLYGKDVKKKVDPVLYSKSEASKEAQHGK